MHHYRMASDRYRNTAVYFGNHLRTTNKIKIKNSFHTKDVPRWENTHTQFTSLKEVHINSFNNFLSAYVLGILLGANDYIVTKMLLL